MSELEFKIDKRIKREEAFPVVCLRPDSSAALGVDGALKAETRVNDGATAHNASLHSAIEKCDMVERFGPV